LDNFQRVLFGRVHEGHSGQSDDQIDQRHDPQGKGDIIGHVLRVDLASVGQLVRGFVVGVDECEQDEVEQQGGDAEAEDADPAA